MPAPILRHYKSLIISAASGAWYAATAAVPANRALVVATLSITRTAASGSITFDVCIDTAGTQTGKIANRVLISTGEEWERKNLVVGAGEIIYIYLDGPVGNDLAVNIFGEEVDV